MENKDNIYYFDKADFKKLKRKKYINKTIKIVFAEFIMISMVVLIGLAIVIPKTQAKGHESPNTTISQGITFTVKEYNNKIAVFSTLSSEPLRIYDTDPLSLPEKDREMLQNGIDVSNAYELEKLIEDLTS